MIVTSDGVPIEFVFSPGSEADLCGLRKLAIDLPRGSFLYPFRFKTWVFGEENSSIFFFEMSSRVHGHGAKIRKKIGEEIDNAKTQVLNRNGYT